MSDGGAGRGGDESRASTRQKRSNMAPSKPRRIRRANIDKESNQLWQSILLSRRTQIRHEGPDGLRTSPSSRLARAGPGLEAEAEGDSDPTRRSCPCALD